MKKLLTAVALLAAVCTAAEAAPNGKAKSACPTFNACMKYCVDIGGPPAGNGSSLVQYHCARSCQHYERIGNCPAWVRPAARLGAR